jgi:hypothetical protein
LNILSKFLDTSDIHLNTEKLSAKQQVIFWLIVLITFVVKIFLIPYNMMDMGDSATRVWNAMNWAEKPFFVEPSSGHPLWFYFMTLSLKLQERFILYYNNDNPYDHFRHLYF